MTAVLDTRVPPPVGVRPGAFGNATHLVCRACGEQSPLGPFYACMECFGPLEVDYDPELMKAVTREQIEAGPQNIWRYVALLPVGQDPARGPATTRPRTTDLTTFEHVADSSEQV